MAAATMKLDTMDEILLNDRFSAALAAAPVLSCAVPLPPTMRAGSYMMRPTTVPAAAAVRGPTSYKPLLVVVCSSMLVAAGTASPRHHRRAPSSSSSSSLVVAATQHHVKYLTWYMSNGKGLFNQSRLDSAPTNAHANLQMATIDMRLYYCDVRTPTISNKTMSCFFLPYERTIVRFHRTANFDKFWHRTSPSYGKFSKWS